MKPKVATAALLCAVLAPHAVLAQGSTNENTCSISSGGSSTGNITVEGTAGQVGQTVTLSSLSVTFPTKLSEQPIIELYNQGAFGPPTPRRDDPADPHGADSPGRCDECAAGKPASHYVAERHR